MVLTGEGADELFAGYDIFKEDKVRRFWARSRSRGCARSSSAACTHSSSTTWPRRRLPARFFGRGLSEADDPLYSHLIRFENTRRCPRLLSADVGCGRARGRSRERVIARLPAELTLDSARARAVPRDHHLHAGLSAALAGRPHADGQRGRGPLPVPRPPALRVRGPAARQLRLRVLEEKYILRRALHRSCPEIVRRGRSLTARRSCGVHRRDAPDYVPTCSPRARSRGRALFDPKAWHARSAASAKSQRRHRHRGDRRDGAVRCDVDDAAAPAVHRESDPGEAGRPTRIVAAATSRPCRVREITDDTNVRLRLLHETLLATAARTPDKTGTRHRRRVRTIGAARGRAARFANAAGARASARRPRRDLHGEQRRLRALHLRDALAGAVFVVINPQTKQDKLAGILADSEAALLLTEGPLARTFAPASRAPRRRGVICRVQLPEVKKPITAFEDAVASASTDRHAAHDRDRSRRADLHLRHHGTAEGRDDDAPGMVFTAGSLVAVPAADEGRAHPQRAAAGLRLRAVSAADERPSRGDPRARALVCLSRTGARAHRASSGHRVPRRTDRSSRRCLDAPQQPASLAERRARHQHRRSAAPGDAHRPLREMFPNALVFRDVRPHRVQARVLPAARSSTSSRRRSAGRSRAPRRWSSTRTASPSPAGETGCSTCAART